MEKIQVAILDSGICKDHSYLKNNITKGISIYCKRGKICISEDFQDVYGHGTACASVIKSECNNVDFFIVKILDSTGNSSLNIVESALEYLLNVDVQIISMSIAISNIRKCRRIDYLCERLRKQGKILVSSLENGKWKSMPATLDSVIGVRGHILEEEGGFWYNNHKKIQLIVDNNPHLHCDLDGTYRMFGKNNSYAAARGAGIVAKYLLKRYFTEEELTVCLKNNAIRNVWTPFSFRESKRYPDFGKKEMINDPYILQTVIEVLMRYKQISDINVLFTFPLYHNEIGVDEKECYQLIVEFEKIFKFQMADYTKITRYDFFSIYRLAQLIEKNIKNGEGEYNESAI